MGSACRTTIWRHTHGTFHRMQMSTATALWKRWIHLSLFSRFVFESDRYKNCRCAIVPPDRRSTIYWEQRPIGTAASLFCSGPEHGPHRLVQTMSLCQTLAPSLEVVLRGSAKPPNNLHRAAAKGQYGSALVRPAPIAKARAQPCMFGLSVSWAGWPNNRG